MTRTDRAGAGGALPCSAGAACGRGSSQAGQATVEVVGLVLVVALALAALGVALPAADGRSIGGFLAHHFTCAVSGRCRAAERELVRAYGSRDAALVRELAPNLVYERGERQLPVDWRACRRAACASAPDDARLDAHHADRGARATAFTRLIRLNGRAYVQYWLYYPDSNTVAGDSDQVWRRLFGDWLEYPGFHRDDWESVQFRVERDNRLSVRISSHGGYARCEPACPDGWRAPTGWVRVSRGSHAGHVPVRVESEHVGAGLVPRYVPPPGTRLLRTRRVPLVPGRNLDERSTTGEGLRLVPLETHDRQRYRPLDPSVLPPWLKDAYRDPESNES